MQLKPEPGSLRRRLIAASCALLSAAAARSQEVSSAVRALSDSSTEGGATNWQVDSALAYYHEDGRIQAVEPVVAVSKDYGDGEAFGLNLTYDALSGSSPNGALTSNKPQTFASPSGKSLTLASHLYTTDPGQLPVDPHYHDQRLAAGATWQQPLTRLTQASIGGKISYEHDFLSATVNALIAHDFNEKNTTVSFGINDESDSIHPIGGAPVPGSDYSLFEKTGGKSKNGVGALLGVTQVMTRTWLSEFNLSVDRFNGYLNDPYKIISVIDTFGNTTGYVYENRPDQRIRHSAYLENRVGWDRASAALSLRYMSDDWGIHSETAQLHLRWWTSERGQYWEPTLRWYRQSAADFYTPWITGATIPVLGYASSDERLGAFRALTYGLKYAFKWGDHSDQTSPEVSFRLEYYRQIMDNRAPAPTALQGLDLYPNLQAVLFQVGVSF
jgi:hypothetical protein